MSTYITLTSDTKAEVFADAIAQVSGALKSGGIAVLPAEHGYLYICDAFDHDAVHRIHILRGDEAFTACQVIVGKSEVLAGLSLDFDSELQSLAKEFWPGLLTMHLMPHAGLNWDLGDGGELSEFAVRVPAQEILRAVAEATGPLAVASAAITGRPATREIELVPVSLLVATAFRSTHASISGTIQRRRWSALLEKRMLQCQPMLSRS